ncbi:hypothetical protein [Curtobacterium flaccumfaciens]|uniref:hypothetical protein n=1 Tax=Curtobacterium flaccumfaciens TaxID=2035 RepID=UPI001AD9577A|nr:hypothetical protein [Curtobacterium flaccumfaciens]MBO9039229.1 hypothetical protein [Curtobacterium flaccumfaciens pv. flaccumfaciens]
MQSSTGVRVVSAAAVVAALVFGAAGLVGTVWLAPWDLPRGLLVGATVLGGIAAVVVLVAAVRARDRRALTFAVSVLGFALVSLVPGLLIDVFLVVAQAALVAFGVVTVRSEPGVQRAFGWIVTVTAAAWFVTALLSGTVLLTALPQESLGVAFAVPGLLQTVAYLAAAVLVAVPLLRPVGRGAGVLWASAEVR